MLRQQKLLTVDAFPVQVRFEKYFFLAFFAGFNPGLVRTHWWLRSYSSQALEGYKLKAVFIFNLLSATFCSECCNFWHKS